MRAIYWSVLLALAWALAACGGPKVLAGDGETVSITAGPLDDVDAIATAYCRRFGKHAVAIGDGPLGPDTTERLYDYNCVAPAAPAD